MTNNPPPKAFDPEERTYYFANLCRQYCQKISKTSANLVYSSQLIRSSGSVAANYIEANEAVSQKDFLHRLRICRKEAKESRLWLRLSLPNPNTPELQQKNKLMQEALELIKIFNSIIIKKSPPKHL